MTWNYFLLRNVDPELRRRLSAEAKTENRSLADLIRAIMCDHFELECEPSRAESKLKHGASTLVVGLQPELHRAIKTESEESGETMRSIILDTLESHYREEAVT